MDGAARPQELQAQRARELDGGEPVPRGATKSKVGVLAQMGIDPTWGKKR